VLHYNDTYENRRLHFYFGAGAYDLPLREQIHSLQTDPDAIERVAREKLGWCREDEKIYHFDPVTPEENDE
jgi:hypothetical protein